MMMVSKTIRIWEDLDCGKWESIIGGFAVLSPKWGLEGCIAARSKSESKCPPQWTIVPRLEILYHNKSYGLL